MNPNPASTGRLRWALRLRHPAVPFGLLGALAAGTWLAIPLVGSRPGAINPRPLRVLPRLHLAGITAVVPVAVTSRETTPAPILPTNPVVQPPASLIYTPPPARSTSAALACRVTRCGAVAGETGEWSVEVILEDGARNGRGELLVPAGTTATGRVRLNRTGAPTPWPSTWRIWLPEEEGIGREVELTASFEGAGEGLASGTAATLLVRAYGRIGARHGGEPGVRVATAVPTEQPPVQTLTGRGADGRDYSDLPRP